MRVLTIKPPVDEAELMAFFETVQQYAHMLEACRGSPGGCSLNLRVEPSYRIHVEAFYKSMLRRYKGT